MKKDMGDCAVREHAGLERLIGKMALGKPIMPDPELGQDVAFLAHIITSVGAERDRYRKALEEIASREMAHFHEAAGPGTGSHGRCPVCISLGALGRKEGP